MSATREGVVSDRAEMLAEIAKSRHDQLAAEFKQGGGDISVLEPSEPAPAAPVMPEGTDQAEWEKLDETAKQALVEADAERKAAEATQPPAETVDAPAASVDQPKAKVKIKVDGQELEVDEEAVREAGIKALQKQSAADKRLEESARLKKEAEAEARRILEEAKRQATQTQEPAKLPDQGATSVEKLTDDHFIQAVKAIQYGSEADAMAALKNIVTQAASSGKSEQLTLAEVNEMLEFREATRWANDEYKEILGDPKLKTLFSSEEKRLRAAGDMRPYREVYTDIGNGLREWLKEKAPAAAPATQTRHERKASVVTIPSASARQPAPTQQKELTPSEIVDRMRKERHQA